MAFIKKSGLIASFSLISISLQSIAFAETIIIGKGSGIIWEGLPFNVALNGSMNSTALFQSDGLLAISNRAKRSCLSSSNLQNIGGYMAFPIDGISGVGLVPRAIGSSNYTNFKENKEILSGTIGIPETKGTSTVQSDITSPSGSAWCLPPQNESTDGFYSKSGSRTAMLSGSWVLVADGSQKPGVGTLPGMYFNSSGFNSDSKLSVQILPSSISLRVSTLDCKVSTPTVINFGAAVRSLQEGKELAVKSVNLVASCGQTSDLINANINLQFRALSGLYKNSATRLALNQGGGFITGEISNGTTGSGNCDAANGIHFDSTPTKLGAISSNENEKVFSEQIIWRLCSGGDNLPSGRVTASTELLVTFN
ncbi:hypothetical protein ACE8EZ_20345 [Pantoea deleyi]|uniref:hypothetical protein n=1 Tax=Pantoea deleyi TaxID=470932 RepID=UPI0035D4A3D7